MIKSMFMGALVAAAVAGTASANTPAAEAAPYRTLDAAAGAMSACAGDAREWSPRTLPAGDGTARAADALIGHEDIFERGSVSKGCAFV